MHVIGLDPGPEKSALLVWNGTCVEVTRLCPNEDILRLLYSWQVGSSVAPLVIEKIESFGMAVGAETFETVFWSGRFAEAYGMDNTRRIGRKAIKIHLCGSARATDSNIRYAIMDRFGGKDKAVGKKAAPGPLFGISSHLWSALAVALTFHDQCGQDAISPAERAVMAKQFAAALGAAAASDPVLEPSAAAAGE